MVPGGAKRVEVHLPDARMRRFEGAASSGGQSSGEERASAIVMAAAKALEKRSIEGRQMLVSHVRP
jgi:hypothetical protein